VVHGLHGDSVCRREEEGVPHADPGPQDEVDRWMGGKQASEHGISARCLQDSAEQSGGGGNKLRRAVRSPCDQDPVYTRYRWLQAVLIDAGVKVPFAENGAKGNKFMESFNGHFKEENGCAPLELDQSEVENRLEEEWKQMKS